MTPGTSKSDVTGDWSSSGTGVIDVRISSPGITSPSQAVAAWRAFWATPPTATIIARPIVRAPTVRAVRLGSRVMAPLARRSSARRTRANGSPAIRPRGRNRNGDSTVTSRSTP